jgi:hypothetical protein
VGELVTIEFRSKSLGVDRSLEGRVQECLKEFANSGSFNSAQNLRHLAFPTSEYYASRCLPDGRWVVEIRYDNLLHEGEGPTEAAALVDAVMRISEAIRIPLRSNSR